MKNTKFIKVKKDTHINIEQIVSIKGNYIYMVSQNGYKLDTNTMKELKSRIGISLE